jgi:hypothetical protein
MSEALHPWVVTFLCFGPGYPAPAGERLRELPPDVQHEIRKFFRLGRPAWACLWQEHRAELEAEGARLRIPRRWHGQYFGQHLAGWEKR